MPKRQFMSLAAVASLGIAASPVRAATFLSYTSQPGDYIGGGRTQTLTVADGNFKVSRNYDNGVRIYFNNFAKNEPGNSVWWDLNLAAPGNGTLVPGSYEGATRFPFQSPTEPGLDFSGSGRGCNKLTGRFVVNEAVYGSGGEVDRFAADFEQHCSGATPALFGKVQFDKSDFDLVNLEKLMQLSNKIQEYPTALFFMSEPGDYIGGGRTQTFTPADGDFTASRNYDNGVRIYFNNFANNQPQKYVWWDLDLSAPLKATLVPGTYEGATRFPFQLSTKPGLSFGGSGRGCNQLGGRFKVLEAAYGSSGAVDRFDALFEQHCEDELATGPALFGRVRYNATVESKSVPDPTMMLGLLGIGGLMLTQRRRSKPLP